MVPCCNEWTGSKKINVPLHFLKSRKYQTSIVKDDEDNPAAVVISEAKYSSADAVELNLEPGGGYLARFSN